MFTNIQEIKQYTNVSNRLDFELLKTYIEEALRVKVYPYVSKTIVSEASGDTLELLKKAVANYAIAYAIPFLKVNLSNTGGNYYTDDKMEKSPWWDLRDLGLSSIAMGDRALNNCIELLITEGKLQRSNGIISTVNDFEKYYSLNSSWEVFTKLQPIIQWVWESMLAPQLSTCTPNDLRNYPTIWEKLQRTTVFFTIAEAAQVHSFSFTTTAIIQQWEELPWQKSKILNAAEVYAVAQRLQQLARHELAQLKQLLEKEAIACYVPSNAARQVEKLKSGLYF
ncbi:DUF6712 family protein [Capnocytophaga ochracea]|jgi:hypothetical protein|uniref:Uncharacterized protein n=1 Tax=Capnocytophaga ochracea TaxID=1018 RepID=A0A2X2SL10_CAPOC|nr:DUF6712 family protein [Capnocytophaga ochracea]SQA93812.1 Uncharacterised protein [Capnocytophaga ochracea]DAK46675.1 MAG TPA: hypothetical protein [Caudoviricetes sp.]DAW32819.1 MAG TPA: hypothetical protein [Caudoviricetes sp.]